MFQSPPTRYPLKIAIEIVNFPVKNGDVPWFCPCFSYVPVTTNQLCDRTLDELHVAGMSLTNYWDLFVIIWEFP